MFRKTSQNFCLSLLAVASLSACSSSYEENTVGSYYGDGGMARYGGSASSASAYDTYGAYGGMGGAYGMPSNCGQGGGYTQGGLRYNSYDAGRYETGARGSRYGTYSAETQMASSAQGCGGGYWMVPTYQVRQQPPPAVVSTSEVVTTTPAPIIQESCPDGQYRMDNGQCAIMMNEEPEQYVPPISAYPEVPVQPIQIYDPIRK